MPSSQMEEVTRNALLGLVSLITVPWAGVVLILVAGTGIAYALSPWETWLPARSSARRPEAVRTAPRLGGGASEVWSCGGPVPPLTEVPPDLGDEAQIVRRSTRPAEPASPSKSVS
jgi:hypothetical protein